MRNVGERFPSRRELTLPLFRLATLPLCAGGIRQFSTSLHEIYDETTNLFRWAFRRPGGLLSWGDIGVPVTSSSRVQMLPGHRNVVISPRWCREPNRNAIFWPTLLDGPSRKQTKDCISNYQTAAYKNTESNPMYSIRCESSHSEMNQTAIRFTFRCFVGPEVVQHDVRSVFSARKAKISRCPEEVFLQHGFAGHCQTPHRANIKDQSGSTGPLPSSAAEPYRVNAV